MMTRCGRPAARLAAVVAAAMLPLLAFAGPASGAGIVGAGSAAVTTPGATARIDFEPFRISFADGRGRTVLRELAGRAGAEREVPAVPRSQFGAPDPPPPTLYAPLSFLVGSVEIDQFPTFQWNGNLSSVTEGGIEYGAESAEHASRRRGGVRLIVATSDPSGRRLIVDVRPGPKAGTIAVSAKPDDPTGVAAIADSFSSPSGEAFRGFGGRHNSLDQAGTEFYNWTQQENLSSPGLGGPTPPGVPNPDRYLFPNGEHAAYYVQSSFVSPDRYGFLLDRDELSHWRLGSDRAGSWQVQAASRRLDYVVAPGRSRSAIRRLTAIGGRHLVPPRWALGPALDRLVEFPSQSAEDYAAAVRDDLREIAANDVDLASYRIEGWQFLPRPFLRDVIAKLRNRGIRPLVYFRSFVGKDEIGTDDPSAFDEAIRRGYVATKANGDPYVFESNFSAPAAQIDFTDPAAVRWWKIRVRAALRLGARRLHAGLRRAGPGRDALRRRLHRRDHAQPPAGAVPPGDGGGRPIVRAPPSRSPHLLVHAKRLLGHTRVDPRRDGQLPRRRDHRLESLGGARIADDRHAQPGDRRRLRIHDRHRRLLRHPLRRHRPRALHSLGRVGGALAVLPGPRVRRRRNPYALVL
jgi:alpha-D-xyloside xylohydrolase